MTFTPAQLQEIALQLSCPQGIEGLSVADMMYESNLGMIESTVAALKVADADAILELGHGNGKHIPVVLESAKGVSYFGLEISSLMEREAKDFNLHSNASFYLYNGSQIPFADHFFQKAFTVNTIYFWKNPIETLNEVARVICTDGQFCIGFAQKEFMEMLPFTPYGFTLYDDDKLADLVNHSHFKLKDLISKTEELTSKNGEKMARNYTVAVLQK